MKPSVHVLLVEDNAGDILLTREALQEGKVKVRLSVAEDGEEALKFLAKEYPFTKAETPDLILLDINLPRINGHEVLEHVKKSPKYKHIPVVMLTTSSLPGDIIEAYSKQANCYITKPVELEKFIDAMRSFEDFWCSLVQLPPYAPER
jgi:CheY-like chemotaxis protein